MIVFRNFSLVRMGYVFLAALLLVEATASGAWAQSDTASGAAVSASDLEHLVQQIQNPHQRQELLKTLQALIVAAKQGQSITAPQAQPTAPAERPEEIFLAFGRLTEHLSVMIRTLSRELSALPTVLDGLVVQLTKPHMLRLLVFIAVDVGILLVLWLILRLIVERIRHSLGERLVTAAAIPIRRRSRLACTTVVLAVGPYLILLIASGIVLSAFPVGTILSALVGLVLGTLFIVNLSAAYYLITHSLLILRVNEEFYSAVRGIILLTFPILITVMVLRAARVQRAQAVAPPRETLRGLWTSARLALRNIWPIIVISYAWLMALFAVARLRQEVSYMLVASLGTAAVIVGILLALQANSWVFTKVYTLNDRVGQYVSGLEVTTLRYLKVVWRGAHVIIISIGIAIILQVWGVPTYRFLASPAGSDILSRSWGCCSPWPLSRW